VYQKNLQQLPPPYWITGTTSYKTASQSHEKRSELLSLIQLASAQHTAVNQTISDKKKKSIKLIYKKGI
jgi:hypothetical protein